MDPEGGQYWNPLKEFGSLCPLPHEFSGREGGGGGLIGSEAGS